MPAGQNRPGDLDESKGAARGPEVFRRTEAEALLEPVFRLEQVGGDFPSDPLPYEPPRGARWREPVL